MAKEVAFPSGLEDVVAANSSICFIDGKEGRLLYHGYDINDLAENSTFEETIYLLWHGELPTKQQLEEHEEFLRRHRRLPRHVVAHLYIVPDDAVPMEVLRTASSILSLYDEEAEETSEEAHLHTAARIVARLPAIVAVHHRLRSGTRRSALADGLCELPVDAHWHRTRSTAREGHGLGPDSPRRP